MNLGENEIGKLQICRADIIIKNLLPLEQLKFLNQSAKKKGKNYFDIMKIEIVHGHWDILLYSR